MEPEGSFDEGFLVGSGSRRSIVLLSKDAGRLIVYNIGDQTKTYSCRVNLVKFLTPGARSALLVGFDDCQMEIMILSFSNIFKLILKQSA